MGTPCKNKLDTDVTYPVCNIIGNACFSLSWRHGQIMEYQVTKYCVTLNVEVAQDIVEWKTMQVAEKCVFSHCFCKTKPFRNNAVLLLSTHTYLCN